MGHPQGKEPATKHRTMQEGQGLRGVRSLHNNSSKQPNIHLRLYHHIPVQPHMNSVFWQDVFECFWLANCMLGRLDLCGFRAP